MFQGRYHFSTGLRPNTNGTYETVFAPGNTLTYYLVSGTGPAAKMDAGPAVLTVPAPAAPPAPPPAKIVLSGISLNLATLRGGPGFGFSLAVDMSGNVPADTVVNLTSDNPNVSLPANLTVNKGANRAAIRVWETRAVDTEQVVTITASLNGVSKTATLRLTPAPAPPAPVQWWVSQSDLKISKPFIHGQVFVVAIENTAKESARIALSAESKTPDVLVLENAQYSYDVPPGAKQELWCNKVLKKVRGTAKVDIIIRQYRAVNGEVVEEKSFTESREIDLSGSP